MEREDLRDREQLATRPSRREFTRGAARRFLRSPVAKQAAGFAAASLLANALAVVATALITRNLEATEFGTYAFCVSFLLFVSLFFEFGLFVPAARLAAVAKGHDRRDVSGSALLVYIPVGAAFSAAIFMLSFWINGWFHVDAASALRTAAPVTVAFPFVFVLQQLAQGLDRLHVASVATVLAQLVLVALLTLQLAGGGGLNPSSALVIRSIALLIAALGCALWLRPRFGAIAHWTRELVDQSRQWGFQLFVGRVLSIGTYNMDVLMLGLWASPRSVGLYVLAGSLATASGFPVTGLAAALFTRMAQAPAIERRWIVAATAVGAASAVAVVVLAEPVIQLFFSARYAGAAALVLPLALAQFVRGVTTMFNTFLSAHGRGADLRNAGIVLTASNLVCNFALIPKFGAQGAAWASLLALVANLVAHVFLYRRSYSR